MASEPGGPPRLLSINTAAGHEPAPDEHATSTNRKASITTTSAASTPLSSAPTTPIPPHSTRRISQPATSPLTQHQHSRPSSALRRTSSATSLHQRPPSSPGLGKKSGKPEDGTKVPTPKRSISNLIAGLRESHSTMEAIEEPVPLTAPQIAQGHFARELAAQLSQDSRSETVVIVHDACYGHRYSRLKTTKSTLSMIVERPERILASVLGVSAAYVRLGGHHAEGKNAPHPERSAAPQPPFKIRRTARNMDILSPYVVAVHGTSWMTELRGMCDLAGSKLEAGARELSRENEETDPEKQRLHETDLYLCSESLNAFQGALGGVADAVDALFDPMSETKHAFVAVRPPGHHCSADYPSGFCWLNNVHVGIEYAAQVYGLTHAAILDFDLHHGDGSQAIAWDHNSKNNIKRLSAKPNSKLKLGPDIGYYSIHDINSYPCESGDDEKVQAASLCIEDAHGQSIWNVHLQPWKTEAEFWQLYEGRYLVLLEKARAFLERQTARLRAEGKVRPKAAIFISAGFDASEWEGQGMQRHKVNVPTEFYARFTRDVVKIAQESSSGCDGKVLSVLEGGYSDRALCSGVLSHLSGLCTSQVDTSSSNGSLALDEMMNSLAINKTSAPTTFDKSWWSSENLTALEMRVNPPPPPAPGKKGRTGPQPTYATPTESFAYKVVDTDKFARSISGTMREQSKPARAPTPPPPEVDWVTATHELSKLLIPADRQTKSCTAEELGGVRTKKEQSSAASNMTTAESSKPRQLRDRKSKAPNYPESVSTNSDDLDSLQGTNRRQTVNDLPVVPPEGKPRRMSRRLSAGSALGSMNGEVDLAAPPVPAIPANHFAATSSASTAAPSAPGIPVKKTRMPAPPKLTKPSAAAAASAPTSPSASRRPMTATGIPRPNGATADAADQGVNALTSGMKKVTLKVGTREEHDRKQKERLDAERRARALKGAETRKANAAARKAAKENAGPTTVGPEGALTVSAGKESAALTDMPVASAPVASVPPPVVPPQSESVTQAQPALESHNALMPSQLPDNAASQNIIPAHAAAPPFSTAEDPYTMPASFAEPAGNYGPIYTPNLDAGPQHSEYLSIKQEPAAVSNNAQPALPSISNLPPPQFSSNTPQRPVFPKAGTSSALPPLQAYASSSPIRPQSRDQLPAWSSTGPIPFAPQAQGSFHSQMGPSTGHSIGNPTIVSGSTNTSYPAQPERRQLGTGAPQPQIHSAVSQPVASQDPEDVWDVPVTPQRPS